MPYLTSKGLGIHGHVKKTDAERVLSQDQWRAILAAVEANKLKFPKWKRDYTALYLGMMFGLRIGEVVLLQRRHFADLEASDSAHIPTLKRSERINASCHGSVLDGKPCKQHMHFSASRAGQKFWCHNCGTEGIVPTPIKAPQTGVVDVDPPVIEEAVVAYVVDYMNNHMRPDQEWLIEGHKGKRITNGFMSKIFNTYCKLAGISAKYSFHSLRHGRGVLLYSRFQDLLLVRDCLRQKDMKSAQVYVGLDLEKTQEYKRKLNRIAFDPLKGKKDADDEI